MLSLLGLVLAILVSQSTFLSRWVFAAVWGDGEKQFLLHFAEAILRIKSFRSFENSYRIPQIRELNFRGLHGFIFRIIINKTCSKISPNMYGTMHVFKLSSEAYFE